VALAGAGGLCSGALVAPDVVVTAARCFDDPRKVPTHAYFGPALEAPSTQRRRLTLWKTFKTSQKFSPNFDIAWARLERAAPQSHTPVALSTEVSTLKDGLRMTVARHTAMGVPQRGEDPESTPDDTKDLRRQGVLKLADVLLGRYVNDIRFRHLLVLNPLPGLGSCNNDPGGPAFVSDKGKVRLVGLLSGADTRLTQDHTCDSGQAIFTFVGPYLPWLEESAGVRRATSERGTPPPPVSLPVPKADHGSDFFAWCKEPVEDEARHTVDMLFLTLGSTDCTKARAAARKMNRVDLRAAEIVDVRPLASLTWVQEFDLRGNRLPNSTPCPVSGARCLF
jgi:hypothetical protein